MRYRSIIIVLGLILIFYLLYSYTLLGNTIKIWDKAPHSAFTSLVYHDGRFYCCFREAGSHVDRNGTDNGKIRILYSKNARKWKVLSTIEIDGFDLRDPQLSQTPDGKLMLLMGRTQYRSGKAISVISVVSFMSNRKDNFSTPIPIKSSIADNKNFWLWKVTWSKESAYGVIKVYPNDIYLLKSDNGIDYSVVTNIEIPGNPNETAISFTENGNMQMVLRRDGMNAYLAESAYPFREQTLTELNIEVGGPELIVLSGNQILFSSRDHSGNIKTSIYKLDNRQMVKLMTLPSGGDCSYPGMVIRKDKLYISYYSSHEGKTSIYISIIPISALNM